METQRIVSRIDGRTLFESRADSLEKVLMEGIAYGADLRGANLCEADLCGADLCGANLCEADLCGADLYGADLCGANLRGAVLRGADLRGADLCGADLRGAVLCEAKFNWNSHDLIAEVLHHEAGDDVGRRMIAGLVLVSQDWCWTKLTAIEHPQRDWALEVLSKFVRDGDRAPAILLVKVKPGG